MAETIKMSAWKLKKIEAAVRSKSVEPTVRQLSRIVAKAGR
jgi:hypothetical protein